ncbi:MAG: DegV family protein [Dethiobacteraceae bacterium]|jgi:DegV family protein with EDD domain|nr:DegV family protein [Bacillota bacterium]
MQIRISADSSCDLTPQILADYNIAVVPVTVIVGEQAFTDGEDIQPDDIFQYVDGEGKTCRTAAINVHQYYTYFKELQSQETAVIHISLGSGFSSCYQNAVLAAQELPGVYIIDSKNLSSGAGQLVLEAALMANSGYEPEEICHQLNELAEKIEGSFVIDRLDYLYRGGRCSALEAESARLLKIKPCIEVVNGKMIVGKKFRGSFEKAVKRYISAKLAERNDINLKRIFIAHAACSPLTIELVKTEISKFAGFKEIIVAEAGSTVAAHCGPNTLGLFFQRV